MSVALQARSGEAGTALPPALSFAQSSGRSAAALAAFLTDPAPALAPTARTHLLGQIAGQTGAPDQIASLLESPFLTPQLPRLLAALPAFRELPVDAASLSALAADRAACRALDAALAPLSRLAVLTRMTMAAICAERIRARILKQDRRAMEQLLGPAAYSMALREARMVFGALSALDDGSALPAQTDPLAAVAEGAGARAVAVLAAALSEASPLAGQVALLRLTGQTTPASGAFPVLDARQARQMSRLIARGTGA